MKLIVCTVLSMLALAEAGIVSPLFFPNPANNLVFPVELRKVISYGTKPFIAEYGTQVLEADFNSGLQFYTYPVVQSIPASTPLFFIPTLRSPPSTLIANAKAASAAGVVGSSVVAHSDEAVPYSVVANAGPGAAYSSAVLHPNGNGVPTAGAQASITGGTH